MLALGGWIPTLLLFSFLSLLGVAGFELDACSLYFTLNRESNLLSTLSWLEDNYFVQRWAKFSPVTWSPRSSLCSLSSESWAGLEPSLITSRLIFWTRLTCLPESKLRIAIVCCRYLWMNLPKSISFSIYKAALSNLLRYSMLFLYLKQRLYFIKFIPWIL